MHGPPLHVLGVRRSGTTLLRVMLDRSPELAVPDESYFVPQLATRHRGPIDAASFLDDLRRVGRLRDWGLTAADVAPRIRDGMSAGAAIGAIFETYAAAHGKARWGDKTPLYMQHLGVLERLFPDALYVHLVRDGRDAAVSFLSVPKGIMTEGWGYPRDAAGFACLWRAEVLAARALGTRVGSRYLEVRYEDLVADPTAALRTICAFVGISFEPTLLDYVGHSDSARQPHQQRLNQPPTVGVRDWRTELATSDVASFEALAGDVLAATGYATSSSGTPTLRRRAELAGYTAKTAAWCSVGRATQRSPLWRRRHPPVS